MKKTVSILMAALVLMTGLHLSLASHFCGGKLSAVKVSITGAKASCGMEEEADSSFPFGKIIKVHCCDDDMTTLAVDSNYSPSSFQSNDFTQKVITVFAIPLTEVITDFYTSRYFNPNLSPPEFFQTNSVELATICVYRI